MYRLFLIVLSAMAIVTMVMPIDAIAEGYGSYGSSAHSANAHSDAGYGSYGSSPYLLPGRARRIERRAAKRAYAAHVGETHAAGYGSYGSNGYGSYGSTAKAPAANCIDETCPPGQQSENSDEDADVGKAPVTKKAPDPPEASTKPKPFVLVMK